MCRAPYSLCLPPVRLIISYSYSESDTLPFFSLFESGKENIALFVGVDNPAAKVYQRVGFDGIYNAPVEGVDQWVEYGFDSARVDMGLW